MIELFETVEGLAPGNYSLAPDEENRLIMSGKARAVSGPLPQLSFAQLAALRAGGGAVMLPRADGTTANSMSRVGVIRPPRVGI